MYRCNTTARDRHNCPHFSIKAEILDNAVWEGIRERLMRREVIADQLQRLRTEDPTQGDVAAIDRRLSDIERRQRNLMARLADEEDIDLASLIRTDLASLVNEKRRLQQEKDDLNRLRQGWQLEQNQLDELDGWLSTVSKNLEGLDYTRKRLALDALGVTVRVLATDHTPRWDVKLMPDFVTTTTGVCGSP